MAEFGKRAEFTYAGVQSGAAAKIAQLEARRERIIQNFEDGDITREQKAQKLAAINAQMPAVESARRISRFTIKGYVDWKGDPAAVNAELRNLWDYVEMGADMLPVRAKRMFEPPTEEEVIEAEKTADLSGLTSDELQAVGRKGGKA